MDSGWPVSSGSLLEVRLAFIPELFIFDFRFLWFGLCLLNLILIFCFCLVLSPIYFILGLESVFA